MKKRGRNRIQNAYTLTHMYDDYINSVERGSPYDVEKAVFVALCEDWFKYIADILIEQSGIVQLPFRLGHILIDKHRTRDYNKLAVDWVNSKKIGKKVYHLNPHTDGFKYKFTWSKQRCIVKNKGLYRFKASRENSRLLARIINEKRHDFIERGVRFKD